MYLRILGWLRTARLIPAGEHALLRLTGWSLMGWLVTRNAGVPYVSTLLLRSVGAKSGDLRDAALFYVRDGDAYVIVGSRGGSPTHPAWVHNLRANPQAWIWVSRARTPVRAEEVGPADRDRLWAAVAQVWPPYNDYRENAKPREIPLFRLTPLH